MAAASIIICAEVGGAMVDLACYVMSAFVIGFGLSRVKSFIEARGYKVKEGESANESNNKIIISQGCKLEYNYKNKLEDLGNIYFFSNEAKGMLSESFLPMGLMLKEKAKKPFSLPGFIPVKNEIPPYEIFPIPEIQKPPIEVIPIPENKKPIIEIFPPIEDTDIPKGEIITINNDIPKIEIFDKSHNIQVVFYVKVKAQNGDIVEVPKRLLGKDGNIDLSLFQINIKHSSGLKEEGGWSIEDDTAKHGWGKEKKLKNEKGDRVASLDKNGKIMTK